MAKQRWDLDKDAESAPRFVVAAEDFDYLCTAVRQYHKAYNDVITFTRAYIASGGDESTPPERWNELDNLRQVKYAAMIAAAGATQ